MNATGTNFVRNLSRCSVCAWYTDPHHEKLREQGIRLAATVFKFHIDHNNEDPSIKRSSKEK